VVLPAPGVNSNAGLRMMIQPGLDLGLTRGGKSAVDQGVQIVF
jgi:hypothetical protein